LEDYLHWQKQDRKTLERVNQLIREIRRNPSPALASQSH